jgi:flagellar biosynthesis/type III secretory pathway protein FliH
MQLKKNFPGLASGLALMLIVTANCFAQNAGESQRAQDSPNNRKGVARLVKAMTRQMKKQFEPAKLTAEQESQVKALIEKHAPAILKIRQEQQALITPKQRKGLAAAMEQAKEDGLKNRQAMASALKVVGLNAEDIEKLNALKKKAVESTEKVKSEILAMLSDEQKIAVEKVVRKGGGKNKSKKKAKPQPGSGKTQSGPV